MRLHTLLNKVPYTVIQGADNIEVAKLSMDSREELSNAVFVCIHGATVDGHSFLVEAISKGAVGVVVERTVDLLESYDCTVIKVDDTKEAYAKMAAAYFGYPAKTLTTIGVTGTKGKTTTVYMIRSILEYAGYSTGLIGTIEAIIGNKTIPSENTTPDAYTLQKYLKMMVDQGCKYVVMEVSSQGLKEKRTSGITFDYGIFTNLEEDHIGPNEHKDMEEYIACKALLFKQCVHGIVNMDDLYVTSILDGHTCEVTTFGMTENADFYATNIKQYQDNDALGVLFEIQGKSKLNVKLPLPGVFNVYNALVAITLCKQLLIASDIVIDALLHVVIKGRMEIVKKNTPYMLIIDYAHNALSLKSLLVTLHEYQPKRLVCLFGCGGNRSKLRRYEMGEISARLADLTIVTSDNPRYEDPMDIINDIKIGIDKGKGSCITIPDRRKAIQYSIDHAESGDFIILAGKGHEDYQEIKGVKYPLDERDIIDNIFSGKRYE